MYKDLFSYSLLTKKDPIMTQLICAKNLAKIVLFLSICFSTLFACQEPAVKVESSDDLMLSPVLNELILWNDISKVNVANAEQILANENMYFKVNIKEFVSSKNDTPKVLHVYAALSNDSLGFYIIDAEKDIVGSASLFNDLKRYSVKPLDTTQFKLHWNAKNIDRSNGKSNIGEYIAWSRVEYWNESIKRNNWLMEKYDYTSQNDTINRLNPLFAVFEVNVSDLDPLKDHYCFLAVGVDSLNFEGKLGQVNTDLIITNTTIESNKLMFNVEDLVHTIPPCKKNNTLCNVPLYGVLQKIVEYRMK